MPISDPIVDKATPSLMQRERYSSHIVEEHDHQDIDGKVWPAGEPVEVVRVEESPKVVLVNVEAA